MPLCFVEEIGAVGKLGVWKIEEDENTLLRMRPLPASEKEHIDVLKNEKKRRQRLAYRVLLQNLLKQDFILTYNSEGKPFFKNRQDFVSISHSKDYAAVFVSNIQAVGIDIEKISERMPMLASRFLNSKEENALDLNNLDLLHIYWGGKECLYKMYSDKKPLFDQHLSLETFDIIKSKHTKAYIKMEDFNAEHQLAFRKINDYMLVYCY